MEGETQLQSETPVVKAVDSTEKTADSNKGANGETPRVKTEGKKEEEETALDGEFIKVEREAIEVKDVSHAAGAAAVKDAKPSDVTLTSSDSSREVLETQEKVRELEHELETVTRALKQYESENSQLKEEILHTKVKLEESGKSYDDLQINHKKLQEKFIESEEKYSSQLRTLQEALETEEAKHKELAELKESFGGITLELDNSRQRMQKLEQELQFSAGEAQKFEELLKQSGAHAESETERALEFERLLEAAKSSAKEMEQRTASLQEELKGLYEKISEYEKVEQGLKTTTAELSAVQDELARSKSQILDLEQRLSSKEVLISELTQELDLKKASESQVKKDRLALETLHATAKEDLQTKVSELEEIKSRLKKEMNLRESVEAGLKSQEEQFFSAQEELARVVKEKEALETTVADLTNNAAKLKELCSDLEEKLKLSDENFLKTDSLLSQALSNNAELEQKLKTVEQLHYESGTNAATATQKTFELEGIIQASNAAADEAKSQLRELETRFIAVEKRNVELEQQINLMELKSSDAERELREFSDNASKLQAILKEVEEEKSRLNERVQEYQENITVLESSITQTSLDKTQLEEKLKATVDKCTEHEERANMTHQRSLELEDLIKTSHSKADDAGKRVNELELLLEAEKYRIQELEEQISSLEKKCVDAEADSKTYSDRASELASELDAYQTRASSLEIALQTASEREAELTESLNVAVGEKKRLEDSLSSSSDKLAEAENLLEVLKNELNLTQEKLQSLENAFKLAGDRENDVIKKLRSAEKQLEEQGAIIERTTARSLELESQHESLQKDSKAKLQELMEKFTNRDSEAISLFEKVNVLKDQVKTYEKQIDEIVQRSSCLKEELEESLLKLASSESTNEELRKQILEAENRTSQSLSENELLVETNIQLRTRIDELQNLLESAISEKEAAAQQVGSHLSTIQELNAKHTKVSKSQSVIEAHALEAETQLKEALQRHDLETKGLYEKLNALEDQVKFYKEQAHEAFGLAESRKVELEETLAKLKDLESIAAELKTKASHFEKENAQLGEVNLKLTQEVTICESKISDLETKLSAAILEKDETIGQLQSSKKVIEDLSEQLASEGQKLQSQISSVKEENNALSESYNKAKVELEAVISRLEEQLKVQNASVEALKSEVEGLEAEASEKSAVQARLKELEEELQLAQETKAGKKESELQKELERDAAVKQSLEELEAKKTEIAVLQKQVKELEQKLQSADAKSSEKGESTLTELKDGAEIRSRDIAPTVSTPSKRKSKKKLERPSSESSSGTDTQITNTPSAMSFKFILGVALVSIIIGIILGKQY